MMTKKDIVEAGIKLIAVYYGLKWLTVVATLIFDAVLPQSRGNAGLVMASAALIPFLIAVIMVWKSEIIMGWLFNKDK